MTALILCVAFAFGETTAPVSREGVVLGAQLDVARAMAGGTEEKYIQKRRARWIRAGVPAADLEEKAVHKCAVDYLVALIKRTPVSRGLWLGHASEYGVTPEEVIAHLNCWGGEIVDVLNECTASSDPSAKLQCWDRLKARCLSSEAVKAIESAIDKSKGDQYRRTVVQLLRDDVHGSSLKVLHRLYVSSDADEEFREHVLSAVRARPVANSDTSREMVISDKGPKPFQDAVVDLLTKCLYAKQPGVRETLHDVVSRAPAAIAARAAAGVIKDRDVNSVQVVLKRFSSDSSLEARIEIAHALDWVRSMSSVQEVMASTLAEEKRAEVRKAIWAAIDLSDPTEPSGLNQNCLRRLEKVAASDPVFDAELKEKMHTVRAASPATP